MENKEDAFAKLIQEMLNQFILAESDEVIGASAYERSDARRDSRNGYRERSITLRVGKITLTVPRHRDEPFHPSLLDNYRRNEQALISAMMEMAANGVATRNVQKITETLCGTKFSRSTVSNLCRKLTIEVEAFRNRALTQLYPFVFVDAIYFKERSSGRAVSKAFMVALGLPKSYRKFTRTSNVIERENRELRKRQNPIGVFMNEESMIRLMIYYC